MWTYLLIFLLVCLSVGFLGSLFIVMYVRWQLRELAPGSFFSNPGSVELVTVAGKTYSFARELPVEPVPGQPGK